MSNKRLLAIASIALIAVLAILSIFLINRSHLVKINVVVAPSDSKITMDNKMIEPGTQYVKAGNHSFKVSRELFTDVTKTINIQNSSNHDIYLLPKAETQEAINWLAQHPDEQMKREAAGGAEFDQAQSNSSKLPLISELPFIDRLYRVDYGQSKVHPNDVNALALYVSYYSEEGKTEALEWLKFKGYTPSNTEIIFQDQNTAQNN